MENSFKSIQIASLLLTSLLAMQITTPISANYQALPTPKERTLREPREELITIFVHGVIGLKLSLSLYQFVNLLRDATAQTVYQKTIEGVRTDPFFYRNQPIADLGLKKLNIEDMAPGNAAGLAAYLYDSVDAHTSEVPQSTRDERKIDKSNQRHSYYTYGWSGLLSKKARETESEEFLTTLENLCAELRSRNITPKLRLIGFSHGGNLCMQLAHAHQRLQKDACLSIDELILIGTPILDETRAALNSPLFARIYNIYSLADQVQKKEVFSGNFFAQQAFEPTPDAPLPDKLTQIQLAVQKDRIKKNRYTQKEKNFGPTDYSPGHMELWFFGWTPNHYRADYPLHPLPTVVFMPYIINRINELGITQSNFIVTLYPEKNSMSIGKENTPFLAPAILKNLKEVALEYAPEAYTIAEYREHCRNAYWIARDERTPLPARR